MAGYPVEIKIYIFIRYYESKYNEINSAKETKTYNEISSKLKKILDDLINTQLNA